MKLISDTDGLSWSPLRDFGLGPSSAIVVAAPATIFDDIVRGVNDVSRGEWNYIGLFFNRWLGLTGRMEGLFNGWLVPANLNGWLADCMVSTI